MSLIADCKWLQGIKTAPQLLESYCAQDPDIDRDTSFIH